MKSSDSEVQDVYKYKDYTNKESEACDWLQYCYVIYRKCAAHSIQWPKFKLEIDSDIMFCLSEL